MRKREIKNRRTIRTMAANILAVYLQAEDIDRAAGAFWYAEESARLADFAVRHGITLDAAAGAAAAISPGMRWDLVPSHLAALMKNPEHKVPTYSREFVRRAVRCLQGESPDAVLGGPKVRAFYALLASGGASDDVVIDGHAINIAMLSVHNIRDLPAAARVNDCRYRLAAAAYREVAEIVGAAPHAVQAVTWIYWRRALDAARKWKGEE